MSEIAQKTSLQFGKSHKTVTCCAEFRHLVQNVLKKLSIKTTIYFENIIFIRVKEKLL